MKTQKRHSETKSQAAYLEKTNHLHRIYKRANPSEKFKADWGTKTATIFATERCSVWLPISRELLGIERCSKCTKISSFKGLKLLQQHLSSNRPPKTWTLVFNMFTVLRCARCGILSSPPDWCEPYVFLNYNRQRDTNMHLKILSHKYLADGNHRGKLLHPRPRKRRLQKGPISPL